MPHTFAKTMFSVPAKQLQQKYGSRATYERMANSGVGEQELGSNEVEFIAARDSFYISTVTPEGWPYVQHRGGLPGFLRVVDERTLAFADYSGNKQYITAGNLAVNDRFALFLMDYPNRARFKVIGHAKLIEPGDFQEGLNAAGAIGDDRLQKQTQGRVVPEAFTHGTSVQRQRWLNRGLATGDLGQCDTFGAKTL